MASHCGRGNWSTSRFPQQIDHVVPADREEPRPFPAAEPLGRLAAEPEEGVLDGIVGGVFVVQEPGGELQQPQLVPIDRLQHPPLSLGDASRLHRLRSRLVVPLSIERAAAGSVTGRSRLPSGTLVCRSVRQTGPRRPGPARQAEPTLWPVGRIKPRNARSRRKKETMVRSTHPTIGGDD